MQKIVVHMIARDEDHIINEWIVHHILIGFDHLYIYDDQSVVPISTISACLPRWIRDKVTIYRFDTDFYTDEFKSSKYYNANLYDKYGKVKQLYVIAHFMRLQKNSNIKWCFFADADEFMCLNKYENIRDFVQDYKHLDLIYIPWLMYGHSYHIEQPVDYLVMDAFRYHAKEYNHMGKSIVNITKYNRTLQSIQALFCLSPPHFNASGLYNTDRALYSIPVHINHYQMNSVKKFLERKLRKEVGYTNGQMRPAHEIFTFMFMCNDQHDNFMEKYIIRVNQILKKNQYIFEENNNINFIIQTNQNNTTNNIFDLVKQNKQPITYDYLKWLLSSPIQFVTHNNLYNNQIIHYKQINPDLKDMDTNQIIQHYLDHGIDENRITKIPEIPDNFNVTAYKAQNHDLQNMTDTEAIIHYTRHGHAENRKINYD